jgi:hypothetical protein
MLDACTSGLLTQRKVKMFKKTDLMHENVSIFLADNEFISFVNEYTEGANSLELDELYDVYEEFIAEAAE